MCYLLCWCTFVMTFSWKRCCWFSQTPGNKITDAGVLLRTPKQHQDVVPRRRQGHHAVHLYGHRDGPTAGPFRKWLCIHPVLDMSSYRHLTFAENLSCILFWHSSWIVLGIRRKNNLYFIIYCCLWIHQATSFFWSQIQCIILLDRFYDQLGIASLLRFQKEII